MVHQSIIPAIREALRANEIGDASPYVLSYAKFGQSGASFGVFQGDTNVDPAARKALGAALEASGSDAATIARIIGALSNPLPNGSPLSPADEQIANSALASATGKAIVDEMDDHTLSVILTNLDKAVNVASAIGLLIEPKAQLCIALWVNMTGAPTTLLEWINGKTVAVAFPPKDGVVTSDDLIRYLTVTQYFTLHPRNLRHFQESVAAGAAVLVGSTAVTLSAVGAVGVASGASLTGYSVAEKEWNFFVKQTYNFAGHATVVGHKEGEEGFWQRIGTYWLEGTKTHGINGKDHDWPWSAAFISWCMKTAGAGENFRYSTQHSVYIYQAIRDHKNGRTEAGFWGWRLNERKPLVGDLICWARQSDVDFDHQSNGVYAGHTDIIVAVNSASIEVIGGNVGNSVTRRSFALTDEGFLPTVNNGETLFATMENRIS